MKILIIDKVHSKKSELCIDSLINKAKTGEHLELTKINFFTERDENIKYEYYLIILNDIKSFPEELLKFENESKVIIVTENINTTHILECFNCRLLN